MDCMWKADRERLKEWRWSEIDKHLLYWRDGGFIAKFMLLVMLIITFLPLLDFVLDIYLIFNVYSAGKTRPYSVWKNSCNGTQLINWNAGNCEGSLPFYQNPSDYPSCMSVIKADTIALVYMAFGIIEFILWMYDWHVARKIVVSDDVSNSCCNADAWSLQSIKSYNRYCFLKKVKKIATLGDKICLFIYESLVTSKYTLFVYVPQFILLVVFMPCTVSSVIPHVIYFRTASIGLKLLISCFAWLSYPFALCIIRGSLRNYTSFLYEEQIDLLLKSKPDLGAGMPDGGGYGAAPAPFYAPQDPQLYYGNVAPVTPGYYAPQLMPQPMPQAYPAQGYYAQPGYYQ